MKDCVSSLHIGLRIPTLWASSWVISISVNQKKEGPNVWNQTFTDGDAGKTAMFHSFFPNVLEIAQLGYTRRNSTALEIIRILSRIGRIFINLPVAEARDVHSYSHVFENLGKPDHSEWSRGGTSFCHSKAVSSRTTVQTHSKLDVQNITFFCSILKRLHDDHRYSADPFLAHLQSSKTILGKAKKQTVRELSRKTPDSLGAKLLIASSALRAYRNRPLGTLMRCCYAWKPVEKLL